MTIDATDLDSLKGRLKPIGGSRSGHWNSIIINQTVQTLWVKHSDNETRDRQRTAGIIVEKAGHTVAGRAIVTDDVEKSARARDEILVHQLDYRYRPCNFVEIMPRLDEHLRRVKAKGATV